MEFKDFGVVLAAINGVLVFTLIMTLIAQKKTIDEKIRLWARQLGEYKQKLKEAEDKQKRISAELQRMEDRAAAAERAENLLLHDSETLIKAQDRKCPAQAGTPDALERLLMTEMFNRDKNMAFRANRVSDARKIIAFYLPSFSDRFLFYTIPPLMDRMSYTDREEGLYEEYSEIRRMLEAENSRRRAKRRRTDRRRADGKENAGGETECGE